MLSLFPLFTTSFYQSHDGEAHVARFAAYYQAFADGQIPPRWAGNLNYRFGTPAFIFYYPLSGYLSSAIHSIGIHFESTYKILIGVGFILSPLFFYLWTRKFWKKEVAFLVALLYGFAPYHFLDMYVRGDIAEILGFIFIPLVFFFMENIIVKNTFNYVAGTAFSYALLILSHQGVALMFSPVFLVYILLRTRNKKKIFFCFTSLIIGLALSAFFWFPALYEGKYTNTRLFILTNYQQNFPSLSQLVYSHWGFGADVGSPDGLSPQIGVLYILFVCVGAFQLVQWKREKRNLVFWLVLFASAVFISLPIASFLWKTLPIIKPLPFSKIS